MASYLAIEPEYMWKVEPLDDGRKLLTIADEFGEVRIAWNPSDANKLSEKLRTVEPASGIPDGNPSNGG